MADNVVGCLWVFGFYVSFEVVFGDVAWEVAVGAVEHHLGVFLLKLFEVLGDVSH